MRLTKLIFGDLQNQVEIIGTKDVNILGLTADSRIVEPGFLFVALEGTQTNGLNFVSEAINRGAVAILARSGTKWDEILSLKESVSLITSKNPRLSYSDISAKFYGSQPETVAAITGTNGKSSVADFVRQLWTLSGVSAASLGTLGLNTPSGSFTSNLTTPDPPLLHEQLSKVAKDNINHLTLEASSHGLAQHRLDNVNISIAAFTNLSRDHLDYHITFDNYFASKVRLFSEILSPYGSAVLNQDDSSFETLKKVSIPRGIQVLSYGQQGKDICILDIRPDIGGQHLKILVDGVPMSIRLPLIGDFQSSNVLCALGIVWASGVDSKVAINNLENLKGVPGRLQLAAKLANGAAVYVDYAHTPDALKNVLKSMRPHTKGDLDLVFGCGGDRDPGKRSEMGAIAASCADKVIITDDNPRTEDAASIRREIMESCNSAIEIGSREQAIYEAIDRLKGGDLLVIAGKGHEHSQLLGDAIFPFNDVDVATKAVQTLCSDKVLS